MHHLIKLLCLSCIIMGAIPVYAQSSGIYEGLSRPYRQVSLTVRQRGQVEKLTINEGQTVKAGELLLKLDDRLQLQQIAVQELAVQMSGLQANSTAEKVNAEARLEEAEFRYTQLKEMGGSASKLEMEQARLQVVQAKAGLQAVEEKAALASKRETLEKQRLEQEKEKLKFYELKAPFDGLVYRKKVELGQSITENDQDLILLIDQSRLKVDFQVPQDLLALLKVGEAYTLVLDDLMTQEKIKAEAKLVLIDAMVDPASLTCRVMFEVPNTKGRFRSGQSVKLVMEK